MMLASFLVFCLACVTVFTIAVRLYGVACWGALVVSYMAFMLLIFPSIAYFFEFYDYVPHVISEDEISYLYLMMSLALLAYFVGYLGFWSVSLDRKLALNIQKYGLWVSAEMGNRRVALFMLVVASLGNLWSLLFGYFGLSNRGADSVAAGAGLISLIAVGLSVTNVLLWVNGFERSRFKLAFISLGLCLASGVLQNSKAAMAMPLIQILLAYYFVRGRLPWLAILSIAVLFLGLIFPLVQGFRYAVYFNLDQKSTDIYVPLLVEFFLSGQWLSDISAPEGERVLSFGRGIFHYMVTIFRDSGSVVAYMGGATFFEGLSVMIPRFMFSDKPDMSTGNWTGRAFGFVDESDLITNVSPTWFGEFYMNFGVAGLLVGSLVFGWFSRRIDASVFFNPGGVRWLMVIFVLNITWIESFIGMTVLVFIRSMFVFSCLLFILSKLDRFVGGANISTAIK